ncbi:hypothetical protein HK096_007982, partial [Nowakowskiella sp. JEL0078]
MERKSDFAGATNFRWLIEKPQPIQNPLKVLKLNGRQAMVFTVAFLGWALDAFGKVVYTVPLIAAEFKVQPSVITSAITLTLLLRPVGALIFGLLADRFGRRWPLMIDVLLYSALELASGFAPDLNSFLIIRTFFGIAMGGEWGLGSSLAMETLPAEARGVFSGILQQGYATGNLLGAALFYLVTPNLGWRALFWIGSFPAFLILLVRFFVPESEAWEKVAEKRKETGTSFWDDLKRVGKQHWLLAIYCVALMSAFNFFSHGSQDLYPTFLQKQLGYSAATTTVISIIQATGAIIGGTIIGYLSQYFGRRRAVLLCGVGAAAFLPLWTMGGTPAGYATGAWFMQFFVQGAWGVVPALLNEISPPEIRGTFPSLCYQLGNMISASSAQIESSLGESFPLPSGVANYGLTQGVMIGITCALLIILIPWCPENRDKDMMTLEEETPLAVENIVKENQ